MPSCAVVFLETTQSVVLSLLRVLVQNTTSTIQVNVSNTKQCKLLEIVQTR